jgi:hypothetical protein
MTGFEKHEFQKMGRKRSRAGVRQAHCHDVFLEVLTKPEKNVSGSPVSAQIFERGSSEYGEEILTT